MLQASRLEDLRLKLETDGLVNISYLVVNHQGRQSQLKHHLLKEKVSEHIHVFQQDENKPDVWSLLNGKKDDFLIYDRCGHLVSHLGLPYTFLSFPYVEEAIRNVYCENKCGSCNYMTSAVDDVCNTTLMSPAGDAVEEQPPAKTPKEERGHGHRRHHHHHHHNHEGDHLAEDNNRQASAGDLNREVPRNQTDSPSSRGHIMASPSSRLQTKPVITCLKSVLLIYSFIFWFTGVILLAVGIWGKVSLEVYFSLLNEKATNVPFVLIGTGAIIILLGTFGCFATCRASTWMLKLYAMFLSVIFLVELVAAIVGFVFRHEINKSFHSSFKTAIEQYNSTVDPRSQAVDRIQRTLKCCGAVDYRDWEDTEYFNQKGVPQSCCNQTGNCTEEEMKDKSKVQNKVFSKGCVTLVTSVMEEKIGIVAGISFGIACFQLIGIFLACCLSRYITNNQYEMV